MTRALVVFAASATVLAVYGCWCDWHARRWRQRTERLVSPGSAPRDLETEAAEAERNAILCAELAVSGPFSYALCLQAADLRDQAQAARVRALDALWNLPAVEPRRRVR